MSNLVKLLALPLALLAAAPGCGDGIECPGGFVVFVTSMPDGAFVNAGADVDPETDGVQIDIATESNLSEDSDLTLTVIAAGGEETYEVRVNADGRATFSNVTIPPDVARVTVQGADKLGCGTAEVTIEISLGEGECSIAINEGLIENENFEAPVLNGVNDSDPETDDFQANVTVTGASGARVSIEVLNGATGGVTTVAEGNIGEDGTVVLPATLGQGGQALWANCGSGRSALQPLFVDTEPPLCDLTFPVLGAFVTPTDDEDDMAEGIQVTLSASVAGDDLAEDATVFQLGEAELEGTPVTNGTSTATAEFGSPGPIALSFSASDIAGNSCLTAGEVTVDVDGCSITHEAPTGTVIADSNLAEPGLQTVIEVQVDAACEGQQVATTCGNGAVGSVGVGGLTQLEVTLAEEDNAEGTADCRTTVTASSGFETFADATFAYDTLAPFVQLQIDDPMTVTCGSTITDADDANPMTEEVEIVFVVVSPQADERRIRHTIGPVTIEFPGLGPAQPVTLLMASGLNKITGVGLDASGNEGTKDCELTLVEIAVGFSPPIADGLVGTADDAEPGTPGFQVDLVGTVSDETATVMVVVDGGLPQAATVVGNTWTLPSVDLTAGDHTVDVEATAGMRVGLASLDLTVDLAAPTSPAGLIAEEATRQSLRLQFTAPDGAASYVGRVATEPLTDMNFDSTGTPFGMPTPGMAGATETATVSTLRAGTEYYVAIAAVDAAGNRSPVATAGALVVDFDASAAISAPSTGDTPGFGYRMARGDFNNDTFTDVAVTAPFTDAGGLSLVGAVYVFFGGPDGLSATPDVTIEGAAVFLGQFGSGITTIRWDDDDIDDLAIGAPFDDGVNGRVYIFSGGDTFNPTSAADASTVIGANPAAPDAFASSGMGWTLATARFDADNRDDLAIGTVNSSGGAGGLVVLYGGGNDTSVLLSQSVADGMGATKGIYIENPNPTYNFQLFGFDIRNVGPTEGGADGTDDISVGYFTDFATTLSEEYVFVLRGRAQPAAAGLETQTFGAADLTIVDSSLSLGTNLGERVGSIEDKDGDGARDLLLSASGRGLLLGSVYLVSGDLTGTVELSDIGVLITEFQNAADDDVFGALLLDGRGTAADIDNDGLSDLVVGGGQDDTTALYIWYGDTLPIGGVVTADLADHTIPAPDAWVAEQAMGQPEALNGIWADVNGDGLDDICWADHRALSGIGEIQVLWDEPLP